MQFTDALVENSYSDFLKHLSQKPYNLHHGAGYHKKDGKDVYRVVWVIPGDVTVTLGYETVGNIPQIVVRGEVNNAPSTTFVNRKMNVVGSIAEKAPPRDRYQHHLGGEV